MCARARASYVGRCRLEQCPGKFTNRHAARTRPTGQLRCSALLAGRRDGGREAEGWVRSIYSRAMLAYYDLTGSAKILAFLAAAFGRYVLVESGMLLRVVGFPDGGALLLLAAPHVHPSHAGPRFACRSKQARLGRRVLDPLVERLFH